MRILFVAAILFSLSGQAKESVNILVTGSSTIAPLMLEISKRFEKKNPNFRIEIQTGGSSRGIADQRRQLSQLGMVSRALQSKESDLKGYLIARDGVGIIVHKSNPMKSISTQQVIDIYSGKIKNWKDLGWVDQPISVVHKASGRSTLEVFLKFFKLKNSQVKASTIIGDNEQGVKTVAGNPYSIGYVSVGTAEYNQKIGVPIRALALNGIAATVANVRKGVFPITRELNLVAKGASSEDTKKLIQYATSSQVKDLIEQFYFISISQ